MDPDLLSKDAVAALLECEVSTVEEKARTGELPGVKIGKSWQFPRAALFQRLNEMALSSKESRANRGAARRERVNAEIERNRRQAAISSIRDARSSAR
jgi:excisionase family DNA binding protein